MHIYITRKINYYKYYFCFWRKNINFATQIKRDVAQLVARYVRDVEVAGSNLVIPTESGENSLFQRVFA